MFLFFKWLIHWVREEVDGCVDVGFDGRICSWEELEANVNQMMSLQAATGLGLNIWWV